MNTVKSLVSALRRTRSASDDCSIELRRGMTVDSRVGVVILISEAAGRIAATALHSVALHTVRLATPVVT